MESLIELPIVPLSNLIAVYLQISENIITNAMSPHQVQHHLARSMLQWCSVKDSLTAPTTQLDQLLIVGAKNALQTDAFHADLALNDLKILAEMTVQPWMLQACFKFTLVTKLAPDWNRIGLAFVYGSDFLQDVEKRTLNRIDLDVLCSSIGVLIVNAKVSKCKIFPLEMCQLSRPVHPRWCFMLPKLSRGQVIGYRTILGGDCQFTDYNQLRQYWLDSYGYHLPGDAPEFYFEVVFQGIGSTVFTYPPYCVLSSQPEVRSNDSNDSQDRLTNFRELFHSRIATVCGVSTFSAKSEWPKVRKPLNVIVDNSQKDHKIRGRKREYRKRDGY